MADNADETSKAGGRSSTEIWVLGVVAGVALLCVSLLAVALALILGKGSFIQVNPVFNGPDLASQVARPTMTSPSQMAPVQRGWAVRDFGGALPGAVLAVKTEVTTRRASPLPRPSTVPGASSAGIPRALVRSRPIARSLSLASSKPSYDGSESGFTERGDAGGSYSAVRPLPMPLRVTKDDSVASAQGSVPGGNSTGGGSPTAEGVAQIRGRQEVALTAGLPVGSMKKSKDRSSKGPEPRTGAFGTTPASSSSVATLAVPVSPTSVLSAALASPSAIFTAAPTVSVSVARVVSATSTGRTVPRAAKPGPGRFVQSSVSGAQADAKILGAHSAAFFGGLTASKGTLFFAAHVLVVNKLDVILPLSADAFDLRDADGDSYMAEPGAPASSVPSPLPAGGSEKMTVVFVVPTDVALRSLALTFPGETDVLPLSKK